MNASLCQPNSAFNCDGVRIIHYCADGQAKAVDCAELAPSERPDDMFWIDLQTNTCPESVLVRLKIPAPLVENATSTGSTPLIGVDGEFAWCRVAVPHHTGNLKFDGKMLDLFLGPGFIMSRHERPIAFIDALREREYGHSRLGCLDARSFMGSLLDWSLDTYFEAVMQFEGELDRIEADILEDRHDEDSVKLANMRKTAARLRRMINSHRIVFSSLARADFMPEAPESVARQFERLEQQFLNAVSAVEGMRELVIGTLEGFTNRIALRTNKSLRVLSFLAATFGFMSVVVGAMGMNFETSFFGTQDLGFFVTIGAMLAVSALLIVLSAHRKWF